MTFQKLLLKANIHIKNWNGQVLLLLNNHAELVTDGRVDFCAKRVTSLSYN